MTLPTSSFSGALTFDVQYVSATEATGQMPIQDGILNPFGSVHAGAMIWFADVVATTLALQGERPTPGMSGFPLAINLSANLLSNSRDGVLHATATFVKKGRRVSTVRTSVFDDNQRLLLELTSTHVPS